MKKISILIIVFSLLFITCIEEEKEEPVIGKEFWACNISEGNYYKVRAQMLAENDLCRVWADITSGVTVDIAQKVADVYKNDIYTKMKNTFGYSITLTDNSGIPFATVNTVQFINYLATGNLENGKLTILLTDIKDKYQQGVNDSFVAGYFWAGNLFKNTALSEKVSNECDMIYIDTYPGIPGSEESNETLAHEMQHLMNFAGTVIRGKSTDIWIDEGLSVTAEWVYRNGEHSVQRLGYFNGDKDFPVGLLDKGNNFFVWGNHEENPYAVLDDYSTVYLFFQWLRLQSNKEIYRKISASDYYDYNAVFKAFNDVIKKEEYKNWESILQDWLAANFFKKTSGRYGYGDDQELNKLKTHYAPGGLTSINLFPGEGVYSNVNNSPAIPTKTGNINYAGLSGSSLIPSGSTISSGAWLTYNANTDIDGTTEPGKITGAVPPPASAIIVSGGRSIGESAGPFPISAGDMLRRKGKRGAVFSGGLNFPIPDNYKGIKINE